jgi:hypothetical protein
VPAAGSTRPPVSPSSPSLFHRSEHFAFQHGEADSGYIAATASALESRYAGILELLAVDRMPVVTVTWYTDHAAMAARSLQ